MINTRKATLNDSRVIFTWRNDELTRRMSHQKELICWEEHNNWFKSALEDDCKLLLLCEYGNVPRKIALVMFKVNSTGALVSINLSPEMRGKGLSKQCLGASVATFRNVFPKISSFAAEIKRDNVASQKIFSANGFVCLREENKNLYYECHLE